MLLFKDKKNIILAAIAIAVIGLAVIVTQKKAPNIELHVERSPFLKDLQGNVDNVAAIAIKSKGGQLKAVLQNGQWVLPNRHNYPVDLDTLRKVVVNAEKLEIVEKKTDDPKRLDKLGLGDPEKEDSDAARVVLMDASEKTIYADFVKGQRRRSGQVGVEDALYVRYSNENQAWLVMGDFDLRLDPNALLSRKAYRLEGKRMAKVTVSPPVGQEYILTRVNPDHDFMFNKPAGAEYESNTSVNNIGLMLDTKFTLEDALPRADKPFDRKLTTTTTFETYDGLALAVETLVMDDGFWAHLNATAKQDAKKAEADEINAVAKDWVYKVSKESGALLTTDFESLLKKEKPKK